MRERISGERVSSILKVFNNKPFEVQTNYLPKNSCAPTSFLNAFQLRLSEFFDMTIHRVLEFCEQLYYYLTKVGKIFKGEGMGKIFT
jgi:hypothetical protein